MAAFRFAAVDNVGKESKGVLEADSARLARQLLRGRGLIPLSVDPVMSDVGARAGGLSLSRRLSQTERRDHTATRFTARRAVAGFRRADRDGRAEREAKRARADGVDPH